MKLNDSPDFTETYKAEAGAGGAFLDLLRKEQSLDWTYPSPSAVFAPGERTASSTSAGISC